MKTLWFKYILGVAIFVFHNTMLIGQSKENDEMGKHQGKTYFSTDIYYISDAVFMGRKDSIAAPYLYPILTYHHKSGFYATGSLSYLTKSNESRVDLFLVSGGFDFTIKNLTGDISLTKYFFNDDSYNVISQVTADITGQLKYDFNVFNLSLTASNYFNNEGSSDFIMSTEISHDFVMENNKVQISPSLGFSFGSQNFYEEYYINKQYGTGNTNGNGTGNGSGQNGSTTTTTVVSVQENKKFNLLAVELSSPIWYSNKSFTLMFLPTYVFPKNASNFVVDGVTVQENLKDTFYWIVGLGYRF